MTSSLELWIVATTPGRWLYFYYLTMAMAHPDIIIEANILGNI
jgi:hypothetical protein